MTDLLEKVTEILGDDPDKTTIKHYGVKGMRWGVIDKSKYTPSSSTSSSLKLDLNAMAGMSPVQRQTYILNLGKQAAANNGRPSAGRATPVGNHGPAPVSDSTLNTSGNSTDAMVARLAAKKGLGPDGTAPEAGGSGSGGGKGKGKGEDKEKKGKGGGAAKKEKEEKAEKKKEAQSTADKLRKQAKALMKEAEEADTKAQLIFEKFQEMKAEAAALKAAGDLSGAEKMLAEAESVRVQATELVKQSKEKMVRAEEMGKIADQMDIEWEKEKATMKQSVDDDHNNLYQSSKWQEILNTPLNTIEHFGIKGMKWGVRRTPEQLGHKPSLKEKVKSKITDRQMVMMDVLEDVATNSNILSQSYDQQAQGRVVPKDVKQSELGMLKDLRETLASSEYEDQVNRIIKDTEAELKDYGPLNPKNRSLEQLGRDSAIMRRIGEDATDDASKLESMITGKSYTPTPRSGREQTGYGERSYDKFGNPILDGDERRAEKLKNRVKHLLEPEEDDILHFGIKGMKWGVRRTPEQLGHKPTTGKEDVKSIDSKELQARVNRLNLEQQYERLTKEEAPKVEKGEKYVRGMIKYGAETAAREAVKTFSKKLGSAVGNKVWDKSSGVWANAYKVAQNRARGKVAQAVFQETQRRARG